MTITRENTAPPVPTDLDLRRQNRHLREELQAHREQEDALREHLESVSADLAAAQFRYAELHVCYVDLLTHARATVAAAARGEAAPMVYIAGHLKEVGLMPDPQARPEQVVAEGLAKVARREARS